MRIEFTPDETLRLPSAGDSFRSTGDEPFAPFFSIELVVDLGLLVVASFELVFVDDTSACP